MEQTLLKNIPFETATETESLVSYQQGQIVSRTLAQNGALSVTLFAFDAGEEISSHKSGGDALIHVLDGAARVTICGGAHTVRAGECIAMPAGVPHAVLAQERFKMLLVVVFPGAAD